MALSNLTLALNLNQNQPRLVISAFIEELTITVSTTISAGESVTLRIPAPHTTPTTRTAAGSGTITKAIFDVMDAADGSLQYVTLIQATPGEDVSTVVTLPGSPTSFAATASDVFIPPQTLSTLPPDIFSTTAGSTMTTMTTTTTPSSAASFTTSMPAALATPSQALLATANKNAQTPSAYDDKDKAAMYVGFAIGAVFIVFLWIAFVREGAKDRREAQLRRKAEKMRARDEVPAVEMRGADVEKGGEVEKGDLDDPLVAEIAARVRAAEDLMEQMQQQNRIRKAAGLAIQTHHI